MSTSFQKGDQVRVVGITEDDIQALYGLEESKRAVRRANNTTQVLTIKKKGAFPHSMYGALWAVDEIQAVIPEQFLVAVPHSAAVNLGFHVGQKVRCVDDKKLTGGKLASFTEGKVYTILDMHEDEDGNGFLGFQWIPGRWNSARFVPVLEGESIVQPSAPCTCPPDHNLLWHDHVAACEFPRTMALRGLGGSR